MAVPPLVSVTVWAGLVVFTVREPKPRDALESTTVGAGAVTVSVAALVLVLLPSAVTKFPGLTVTV